MDLKINMSEPQDFAKNFFESTVDWSKMGEKERVETVKSSVHQTAHDKFFIKNMDLLYHVLYKNREEEDLHLRGVYESVCDAFREELKTIELSEQDIKCMISVFDSKLVNKEGV